MEIKVHQTLKTEQYRGDMKKTLDHLLVHYEGRLHPSISFEIYEDKEVFINQFNEVFHNQFNEYDVLWINTPIEKISIYFERHTGDFYKYMWGTMSNTCQYTTLEDVIEDLDYVITEISEHFQRIHTELQGRFGNRIHKG